MYACMCIYMKTYLRKCLILAPKMFKEMLMFNKCVRVSNINTCMTLWQKYPCIHVGG